MKKILFAIALIVAFPCYAIGAVPVLGINLGIPQAKGKSSNDTFSSGLTYGLFIGVNSSGSLSFEGGYNQLIDMESRFPNNGKLRVALSGVYVSGRYSYQLGRRTFGYAKLGAYGWTASVRESQDTRNTTLRSQTSNTRSATGVSPLVALGADFVLDENQELGLRVELEHVANIDTGVKLVSADRERNRTEAYDYNSLKVGVVIAF